MKAHRSHLMQLEMRLPFLWHNRIYENDPFNFIFFIAVVGVYRGLYDLSPRIA